MKRLKHECTDEIVCPYCGYEFEDSYEFGNEEDLGLIECDCGEEFYATMSIEVTYSTKEVIKGNCAYCGRKHVVIEDYHSSEGKLKDVGVHCCKQEEINKLRIKDMKRYE
jgi:uncharacterized Zn-finger protein